MNTNSTTDTTSEPFIYPIRPSPDDPRDQIFENARQLARSRSDQPVASLPKTLDLRPFLNSPRNQGRRGTCAAFASSAIKEYHERIESQCQEYFSPNSVYFYRLNKPAEGMYLRDAMDILLNQGIAPEFDFPYQGSIEPESVPRPAIDKMANYRIKEYARINAIQGLKEALLHFGPCIIAFPVYDNRPEFWRVKSSDVRNGGHAVAVVGYNAQGFIIRNSWGSSWNGDGHVLYPYTEWGVHWEVWSAMDAVSPEHFSQPSSLQKL